MRFLAVALLFLVATPTVADNETRTISRCVIEVDGKVWQDGPCWFMDIGKDGSFAAGGKGSPSSFAYVYMASDEFPANGFWNGTLMDSHAHDPLGDLERNGACWSNDRAKVCAYR